MDIKHGRRKSFEVDYVVVTEDNMEEVAEWSGGKIGGEGHDRYVRVSGGTLMNARQGKAFAGDVMTCHSVMKTFRAFSKNAFAKTFDEIVVVGVKEVDRSSVTGQFVSHDEAEANPDTTEHETVELPRDASLD